MAPSLQQNLPPDAYLTVSAAATTEIKVQRSRFVAHAEPAGDEATARFVIAEVAARFHDCRHVCHGWRLGTPPGINENRNDDGEPGGTAGEPILAEIRKRELTKTVVVVVRYFGGIKLGTGGLARAYGQAAATALTAAAVREVKLGRQFDVAFPYPLQKTFAHLLQQHEGEVLSENYGVEVSWRIWLPNSRWERFSAMLREATAGAVHLGGATPKK